MVSNIVMAITVLVSLELLTRLLYFTPITILASIILSALPGLIDINEAFHIWKVDKMDFLACLGAFLGVLFASVEIGLMVAVMYILFFFFPFFFTLLTLLVHCEFWHGSFPCSAAHRIETISTLKKNPTFSNRQLHYN